MKKQPWLQELRRQGDAQQQWLERVRAALPGELGASLVNVVRHGAELTLLASSAAWSSRLRYALAEIEPRLRANWPDIVKLRVRVSPAGQSRRPPPA